jgi:hypothetical protein
MEQVAALLLASRAALQQSNLYKKWVRDSPNEAARVNTYWANGGVRPSTASPFGLSYALSAEAYHFAAALLPYPLGDPRG